ncbi:hypothetical protein TSACC_3580 [Terrimicrobium sacchariphilum]|uniref:Uncharacterized protein n=1 Tax=Terrimicrobium sacchariphilum TaxID=690879 RepID=A0A146GEH2_TERSA|nr:hypothetical protein [Terrimicrobium sacchariphilum]GAT35513.1 hypothetical protein TSACC_3580 [Terrimicrobium sacchariphilum]
MRSDARQSLPKYSVDYFGSEASEVPASLLKATDAVCSPTPLNTSISENFTLPGLDRRAFSPAEEFAAELHLRPTQLCRVFQQFNQSRQFK